MQRVLCFQIPAFQIYPPPYFRCGLYCRGQRHRRLRTCSSPEREDPVCINSPLRSRPRPKDNPFAQTAAQALHVRQSTLLWRHDSVCNKHLRGRCMNSGGGKVSWGLSCRQCRVVDSWSCQRLQFMGRHRGGRAVVDEGLLPYFKRTKIHRGTPRNEHQHGYDGCDALTC